MDDKSNAVQQEPNLIGGEKLSHIDRVRIEMVPINEMFYLTAIFDALENGVTTSFMGKR